MRIDHCRDGVGSVVKAVDELEAERNQQRTGQHQVWLNRRLMLNREVGGQMARHIEKTRGEDQSEYDNRARAGFSRELVIDRAT